MKNKRFLNFVAALAVGLAVGAPTQTRADDTEVYTGGNLVEGVRPNVLIILDTSGSMSSVDDPANDPRDRLELLQSAMTTILDEVDNINIGIMRFTDSGGPVLFPVAPIDGDATAIDLAGQADVSVRIAADEDDAEELIREDISGPAAPGDVKLDSFYIELLDAPGFGDEVSVTRRVNNDAGDAEQSEVFYNNTSTVLEMFNNGAGNGTRTIGLNFEDVELNDLDSDGASVMSAKLVLTPQSDRAGL